MSLVRLKAAFETSAMGLLSPDDRAELWRRMVAYMVADCGGVTLYWHVPMKVPDDEMRKRQGELFAQAVADGLTQREIAERAGCSQPTVCRAIGRFTPSAVSESAA